jgi:hypothetical protein
MKPWFAAQRAGIQPAEMIVQVTTINALSSNLTNP